MWKTYEKREYPVYTIRTLYESYQRNDKSKNKRKRRMKLGNQICVQIMRSWLMSISAHFRTNPGRIDVLFVYSYISLEVYSHSIRPIPISVRILISRASIAHQWHMNVDGSFRFLQNYHVMNCIVVLLKNGRECAIFDSVSSYSRRNSR